MMKLRDALIALDEMRAQHCDYKVGKRTDDAVNDGTKRFCGHCRTCAHLNHVQTFIMHLCELIQEQNNLISIQGETLREQEQKVRTD